MRLGTSSEDGPSREHGLFKVGTTEEAIRLKSKDISNQCRSSEINHSDSFKKSSKLFMKKLKETWEKLGLGFTREY